ncbi:hypothetical protein [Paenibacillus bovis]|uniref:Uncharacterized protein n=1 Tax=Paenibacillus bovis TaxID=1616788 RepID=A0A172ZE48_9BACL|nr:hypothetical protein [Paenibacillus bovis]ANF95799.1 hypothetical protein AR543_07125 [Paenibacillus bovis]
MKTKWYLRPGFLWVICLVTPPIGYAHLLYHRKKFRQQEWLGYLAIATLTMAIWLTKFMNPVMALIVLALLLVLIWKL